MDHFGVIGRLGVAYPQTTMSVETIAVYARAFEYVPVDILQAVVDQAIATHKFLPTVAELKTMRRDMGLAMTAEERKQAYCPDSLRGIAIGCDEVFRQRDERQLTSNNQRYLEAA